MYAPPSQGQLPRYNRRSIFAVNAGGTGEAVAKDIEKEIAELRDKIRYHEHRYYVLDDPEIAQRYKRAPAAKQIHHAYLGGLIEHVLSLCGMAALAASHYRMIDVDLLLTGVVLHDIGKIRELSWVVGFDYTIEGTLLGHIQMGIDMVEKAIAGLPDFPDRLRTLVLHMILSHHGKLEFGSPKLPMIPEALVLNFVDDLDAKMQAVSSEFDKSLREGKGPDELTGKVWSLDNRQLLNTKRWLGEDK